MSAKKSVRAAMFVVSSLATLALCIGGSKSWGRLPPLGHLLSPWSGFWKNAEPPALAEKETLLLQGLHDRVTVRYDARRVPHLFAKNDHDLSFAQGYVTARDRLWQMEIQVLATAGRLAEKMGSSALAHDRLQRRRGLLDAARRTVEFWKQDDPAQFELIKAYSAGVNAYVRSLRPEDLPLEYKILNYTPEEWDEVKTARR